PLVPYTSLFRSKNNPRLAYERLGEGDRKLSTEKYKALVVGSHEVTDNELLKNYDIGDLNEDDLEVYKKLLFDQTKNEKYLEMSHEAMLIEIERKSTRLNSSHVSISYAVFCLKKKTTKIN